jgi:hypothetical protein
MAEAPEEWGTMPLPDLMRLLQTTTEQLAEQHKSVAIDEGAYHRKFWSVWTQLPDDFSVAASQRECERHCKELREEVILATSIREGLTAKRDAIAAILAART